MDSKTASELLAHLAPIAQGNAQLIQAATSILNQVKSTEPKASSDSGIVVRELTPRPEAQALLPDPKAPSPENDELAEQIMSELERAEAKGLTPRDLGKKVQSLVPGKPSVPPHQRYRFRLVMQRLTSEQRIVRQNADDPKKLRYVTSSFASESP